jgi:hypothetical protein
MAVRRCPRPEFYTDPERLRVEGTKTAWSKGCGNHSCGFCGPHLADDWARAIVDARPDLVIRMPIAQCQSWQELRKDVNNLLYERRKKGASAAAAWWVESPEKGAKDLVYVERGGPEDLDVFRRQARSRSFPSAYFSPKPDELGDGEMWTWSLERSLLHRVRAEIEAVTYSLAEQVMGAHIELNRPPGERHHRSTLIHTSRGFLEDERAGGSARDAALRRVSKWRNRERGEMLALSQHKVMGMEPDEPDLVWHDEVWWSVWGAHAHRRGWDAADMGLNIFDPPEDADPMTVRREEERYWSLAHPTTNSEAEPEDQLYDLEWKMLAEGLDT